MTTTTHRPGSRVAFDRPGNTPITGTVVEVLRNASGGPLTVVWQEDLEGVQCVHGANRLRAI